MGAVAFCTLFSTEFRVIFKVIYYTIFCAQHSTLLSWLNLAEGRVDPQFNLIALFFSS